MKTHNIFDMYECFRCPSWHRLFEQPSLLTGWITFQLWAVHGRRSKEMALLSVYMARRISSLYHKNGPLWTAKYLKTSKMAFMRALGGLTKEPPYRMLYSASYCPTSKLVPVRLTRLGIPQIVLPIHRKRLIAGPEMEKWARTYMTIFDLYKLIVVVGLEVDVSSIIEGATTPPLRLPVGPLSKPVTCLRENVQSLNFMRTNPIDLGFSIKEAKLMWTAGPNTTSGIGSLAMLVEDAQAFLDKHINLELYLLECLFLPSQRWVGGFVIVPSGITRALEAFLVQVVAPRPPRLPLKLGRVGLKTEPAGKVRLFMIMDSISQRLLDPIHRWVYGLLRTIPTDGTFHQYRPISRLVGKMDTLFSFDLKSATDRIPAEECMPMLTSLFGSDVAIAWRCLLYRPFVVPPTMSVTPKVSDVIFTTGTPLGSLSSWGIFALFHHLLVQQAAQFALRRKTFFTSYAILGDDLVIGHPDVARQYRRCLRWLGVKISQEKSIASRNGSMEFASRFILRGKDVSPVSFKCLAAARMALGPMTSFFLRIEEFREIRISEFFRLKGAGYRILPLSSLPYPLLYRLPKRWLRLWLVYHHPHGSHPLPWVWWLSVGRRKLIPPEALGVLHFQLLEVWYNQPQWLSYDQSKDDIPYWEEVVRYPWFLKHLNFVKDTALRLIAGEILDPLLDYYPMKCDLNRQSSQEESRLALRKWSQVYRLYDKMSLILSKPLPLLLEQGRI